MDSKLLDEVVAALDDIDAACYTHSEDRWTYRVITDGAWTTFRELKLKLEREQRLRSERAVNK